MKTIRFISLIAVIACTGSMMSVAHAYTYTVQQLLPLAQQGNSDAQHNLGWMYDEGKGVAQNDEKAVYWYQQAAAQGDDDAQNNLGNMYYEGRGVRKDEQEAVRWIKKAARQGNKAAIKSLKILGMTN